MLLRDLSGRLLAVSLAPIAVVGSPAVALAQAPASVDEARALHESAIAAFETHEYKVAIERWTEAYALVRNSPAMSNDIAFNLAAAHVEQFGLDHEDSHLTQAERLLDDYVATIEELYPAGPERDAELSEVAPRREKIESLRAAASKNGEPKGPSESATGASADASGDGSDGARGDDAKPNRALVAGGAAALAVGAVGFGLMGAGFGIAGKANRDVADSGLTLTEAEAAAKRGRTGNALAIAGAAAGVVFAAGGGVLVWLGVRSPKKTAMTVTPAVGPGTAGVAMIGRF